MDRPERMEFLQTEIQDIFRASSNFSKIELLEADIQGLKLEHFA